MKTISVIVIILLLLILVVFTTFAVWQTKMVNETIKEMRDADDDRED